MKNSPMKFAWLLGAVLLFLKACTPAFGQTVAVTTTSKTPLNKNGYTGCIVDVNFSLNFVSRNINSDPYFSEIKSLGLQGVNFPGISTADYSHPGGDGYNCYPPCPDQDGGKKFGKDFLSENVVFANSIGATSAYIANVQTGTLQEVYTMLNSGVTTVIWGGEQNLSENASFYPQGGLTYKIKISAWIDSVNKHYSGITNIVDAAPTWLKATKNNRDWNVASAGIKGNGARMYVWNDDANITDVASIDYFFNTTIDLWENNFLSYFPDKDISVLQFGWKARTDGINTGLNSIWLARGFSYFLQNQYLYNYVSFMSVKSLDSYSNNKATLKLIGQLYQNNNLVITSESIDGIKCVTTEKDGKYTMLVINEGAISKTISVTVDGKKKNSLSYSGNYFSTPTSTILNTYSGYSKTVESKPYSITIITF